MSKTAVRWRVHQQRWQQFHQWEASLPASALLPQPTARLRWCEEALALHHRFSSPLAPVLDEEQLRHWRLTRRRLPRRLPARYGSA